VVPSEESEREEWEREAEEVAEEERLWEEDWREKEARAYRPIGRYFVTFSRLSMAMRTSLGACLQSPDRPQFLVEDLLTRMEAMNLAKTFFETAFEMSALDEDETAIAKRLRKQVISALEERNRLAHRDWLLTAGVGYEDENEGGDALQPSIGQAMSDDEVTRRQVEKLPVKVLDAKSDQLEELARCLERFGAVCLIPLAVGRSNRYAGRRVRDVLRIDGEGVVVISEPSE
jgi:hypothetical protein